MFKEPQDLEVVFADLAKAVEGVTTALHDTLDKRDLQQNWRDFEVWAEELEQDQQKRRAELDRKHDAARSRIANRWRRYQT